MVRKRSDAKAPKKKPADFKRPKRKVGKRAAAPANVTSVGITSRRIQMLDQRAMQDKRDDAALTHTKLALSDILPQIGHYNAHVRQRGLQGLRELAQDHPSHVSANVAITLERFLSSLLDTEAVVREDALATWRSLLPAMQKDGKNKHVLRPFATLIAVYLSSGVTHLQVGIRQDMLKAIGILLDHSPSTLLQDASKESVGKLIENFRELMMATQTQGIRITNTYDLLTTKKSFSMKDNSSEKVKGKKKGSKDALAFRLEALDVLHRLLTSISSEGRISHVDQVTTTYSIQTTPALLFFPGSQTDTRRTALDLTSGFSSRLEQLLEPLLDLWLETLDDDWSQLSETTLTHLTKVVETCTAIVSLHGSTFSSNAVRTVRKIYDQWIPSFPLYPTSLVQTNEDVRMSQWYNLNAAIAHFACNCRELNQDDLQERMTTFVSTVLGTYQASESLKTLQMTPTVLRSVLSVLEVMATSSSASEEQMKAMMTAFTRFYDSLSPRSSLFRLCTGYVVQWLESWKRWAAWDCVMQWTVCLSRFLGRIIGHSVLARRTLMSMISVLKQVPSEWQDSKAMEEMLEHITAFFTLDDSTATTFAALERQDQRVFVALVYHLPTYPVNLLRALAGCCKTSSVDVQVKTFMMDILMQRKDALDLAHFVSFLMSAVFNGEYEDTEQQLALVQHVSRILLSLRLGNSLYSIIGPALGKQLASDKTSVLDLHTLTILYSTCLASSLSIPEALEKDVLALSVQVLTQVDQIEAEALLNDTLVMIAKSQTVFKATLNALLEKQEDQEKEWRRLTRVERLLRATCMKELVRKDKASIAEKLELGASTGSDEAKQKMTRLARELALV